MLCNQGGFRLYRDAMPHSRCVLRISETPVHLETLAHVETRLARYAAFSSRAAWPARSRACPEHFVSVRVHAELLGAVNHPSPGGDVGYKGEIETTRFTSGLFTDCTAKMESFANMGTWQNMHHRLSV